MKTKLHLPFAIAIALAAGSGMAQERPDGQQGPQSQQQQSGQSRQGQSEQSRQSQSEQSRSAQSEAQQSQRVASSGQQVPRADQEFLNAAVHANLAEIKVGQLAMERGQSQEVKNFGMMLTHDHTKALAQALNVAAAMNMVPPTEPSPDAQQLYEKLKGLSGEEFDKEFLSAMIEGHQKVIDLFSRQAESGQNMQLQQLAKEELPVLKKHLETAQAAQKGSGDKLGANLPGQPER